MSVLSRLLSRASAALVLAAVFLVGEAPAQPPKSAPLTLALDATDAPRKLLHARITIPAPPGPTDAALSQMDPRRARPHRAHHRSPPA